MFFLVARSFKWRFSFLFLYGKNKVPQKELADKIGISVTNVSNRIKRLIRYGAVSKLGSMTYQLLINNLNNTPYDLVFQLLLFIYKKTELYHD